MHKSNTNFSMLATHVNDLRRMWFAEHEKNRKLKAKMKEFKNIMISFQAQVNFNDSFVEDSFILGGLDRDLSNQSTLEQTIQLNCFRQKLVCSIQKLFIKNIRETFFSIKMTSKNEFNRKQVLKVGKFLMVLINLFKKKEILSKIFVLSNVKNLKSKEIGSKFMVFKAFFRVLSKFQAQAFTKLKSLNSNNSSLDSVSSERICTKKINGKVNETSKLNVRNYFAPLCSLEDSGDESEFTSFSDSCFGSSEQVRQKLKCGINLEKHKKVIKNPKFLSFLQIFREKIVDREDYAFQSILYMYENSICHQEGARLLFEVVNKAVQRKKKKLIFCKIKKFSVSKKIFQFYLSRLFTNIGKSYKKSVFLSTIRKFSIPYQKSSVLLLLSKIKFLINKPCKSAFKPLKSYTYSTLPVHLPSSVYSSNLQRLIDLLNKVLLKSSFCDLKTSRSQSKSSLLNVHKLLSDSCLLKISVTFRCWQHRIYTLPYIPNNKENYFKTSLNFSQITTRPQGKSQPLRVLKKSNFN